LQAKILDYFHHGTRASNQEAPAQQTYCFIHNLLWVLSKLIVECGVPVCVEAPLENQCVLGSIEKAGRDFQRR
jgi:hypothetical protein